MKKLHITATTILLFTLSLYAQDSQTHTTTNHTNQSTHHENHANNNILDAMHAPMMKAPLSKSGNVNQDFLTDMIPHHQGAIDSAKLVLTQGKNQQVLALAKEIIATQEKEIAYFQELIQKGFKAHSIDQARYDQFLKKNADIHHKMMAEMQKVKPSHPDKDFIDAMIKHHEGAVASSRIILEYTTNDTIKKIAQDIIDAQEKEITLMQTLSKSL